MKRVFYFHIFIVGLFLFTECKKKDTTTEPDASHSWKLVDENFDYGGILNETIDTDSGMFLIANNYNIRISKDGTILEKTYHHTYYISNLLSLSPNYFITYNAVDSDLVATFNPVQKTSFPAFLTFQDMTGLKSERKYSPPYQNYSVYFLPKPNDYFSSQSTDSGIVLIQYPDSTLGAIQMFFSKYSYQSINGKIDWIKAVILPKTITWFLTPKQCIYYKNGYYITAINNTNIQKLSSDNSSISTISFASSFGGVGNIFKSHDTLFALTTFPDAIQYTTDGNAWQTLQLGAESKANFDMKSTLTGGYFTSNGKLFDIYQNKYLTTNKKGLNSDISYLNVSGNYAYAISNRKLYKLPLGYLFEN